MTNIASACVALVGCFVSSVAIAATPPHIVVFISDDLGRLDTSIHGSPDAKTPALQKLAASGMTLDNAYVASPSCCPNRFSLLTGLMPARHGAHANHSQVKPKTKFLLPELKRLGYTVASFGKVAHGRHKMAGCDFNAPRPREMSVNVRAYFEKNQVAGPVCLLVGDRRPHVPWIGESTYDPAKITLPSHFVDTPETREHWARYLTDVTGMDAELKRILDIAEQRLGDNVIYLFTSDHGGQWPFGKWNLYDAGTRVPLVVSWKGKIAKNVRSDAMVSWVDILPTLIDVAGGSTSDELDGRSFADVLTGNSTAHRDKVFTTHTGDGKMNIFPIRSVRIGNMKYIHNLRPSAYHTNHSDRDRKDGAGAYWDSWDAAAKTSEQAAATIRRYYTRPEFELFDLAADPHEWHNLADDPKHRDTLERLKRELSIWTTLQKDPLLPHADPYPTSKPLPIVRSKPRVKRKAPAP